MDSEFEFKDIAGDVGDHLVDPVGNFYDGWESEPPTHGLRGLIEGYVHREVAVYLRAREWPVEGSGEMATP